MTTAITCALSAPLMAMDPNDPDHIRHAEAARVAEEKKKSEAQSQPKEGSIAENANPFDHLPPEVVYKIFEEASKNDPQTAKDLTSVNKYASYVMDMRDRNLTKSGREEEEKNQAIAAKIKIRPDGIAFFEYYLNNSVNNRVLKIICENQKDISGIDLNSLDKITDFSPLSTLQNLEHVDLSYCPGITDFSPLSTLKNLRHVDLSYCSGITDFSPLSTLQNLNFLKLQSCKIEDLAPLSSLKNLKHIDLYGCTRITDLSPLSLLNRIELIGLAGCTRITDLSPLHELSNLKQVFLKGCTGISREQVMTLSKILPECTIVSDFDRVKGGLIGGRIGGGLRLGGMR
ncbi:MAG: leucine-rich repeat domain-containing protein [Alphaproteobacteria bacterium]|nr:leucine-rich repeat domain-containing protein [Alphaproteobacteria bacterium]